MQCGQNKVSITIRSVCGQLPRSALGAGGETDAVDTVRSQHEGGWRTDVRSVSGMKLNISFIISFIPETDLVRRTFPLQANQHIPCTPEPLWYEYVCHRRRFLRGFHVACMKRGKFSKMLLEKM